MVERADISEDALSAEDERDELEPISEQNADRDEPIAVIRFRPPALEVYSLILAAGASLICLVLALVSLRTSAEIQELTLRDALMQSQPLKAVILVSALMLWMLALWVPSWWSRSVSREIRLEGRFVTLNGPGGIFSRGTRMWRGELASLGRPQIARTLSGPSLLVMAEGTRWSFPLAHGSIEGATQPWSGRFEAELERSRVAAARDSLDTISKDES